MLTVAINHIQDWSKVCWSVELDLLQRVEICLHDTRNTKNLRVVYISVKRKAMGRLVFWMLRYLTTKAIYRVHLVWIVIFQNITDRCDDLSVLVRHALVIEVKRRSILRRTVWKCIVDGNMDTYLTSSKDIVQESCSFLQNWLIEDQFSFPNRNSYFTIVNSFELIYPHVALSELLMVSTFLILESLN